MDVLSGKYTEYFDRTYLSKVKSAPTWGPMGKTLDVLDDKDSRYFERLFLEFNSTFHRYINESTEDNNLSLGLKNVFGEKSRIDPLRLEMHLEEIMVDDNYPLLIRYAALIFAFAILRYGDYIIKIRSLFDNVPPDIECMTVYRQLYINSRIFIDNFDELCIDYFRECIDVLESSDLMRCNSGVVSAVCEGVGYLCLESADYIKEYKLDKYIVLLKTTITGGEDHATFHLNLARLYCVNKEFSKAKTEVNIAINNIGGHNRNVRIFQFRNLYNRIVFNESLYEIERKNEENLKDIQDKYVARIEEEVRSGQKQSITILGIFSSIVITLVISANFFNGVLSNVPTDQFYEYVLLTLLVGLFLFNMLMVLILLVCKSISFDGLKSGLGIVRSEPDLGDVIKAKGAHPWYMWVFLAFNVVLVGCILAMYVFKYVLQ